MHFKDTIAVATLLGLICGNAGAETLPLRVGVWETDGYMLVDSDGAVIVPEGRYSMIERVTPIGMEPALFAAVPRTLEAYNGVYSPDDIPRDDVHDDERWCSPLYCLLDEQGNELTDYLYTNCYYNAGTGVLELSHRDYSVTVMDLRGRFDSVEGLTGLYPVGDDCAYAVRDADEGDDLVFIDGDGNEIFLEHSDTTIYLYGYENDAAVFGESVFIGTEHKKICIGDNYIQDIHARKINLYNYETQSCQLLNSEGTPVLGEKGDCRFLIRFNEDCYAALYSDGCLCVYDSRLRKKAEVQVGEDAEFLESKGGFLCISYPETRRFFDAKGNEWFADLMSVYSDIDPVATGDTALTNYVIALTENGDSMLLDAQGNVLSDAYAYISFLDATKGRERFEVYDQKWMSGIIDGSGDIVVPCIYDSLVNVGEDRYWGSVDDIQKLIDLDGNEYFHTESWTLLED